MIKIIIRFFTENIGLKVIALMLALILWFYVDKEINKGPEEEMQFLKKIFPSEGITAKRLAIKPMIEGELRSGYEIEGGKPTLSPEYCLAVGSKDLLEKISAASTAPVNIDGAFRTFSKSVPLRPIPGVYMESTSTKVTVTIQKATRAE
ncbi:MAG: YbbR-like domain-containing protein [Candidatus Omnitrophica bacterium]|nr:YbbR-like domain-containing protein [Candidatus Omnitrophota bacterium]